MKPITIIGGGLAGLALGIALRRHRVPVTLREAGHYPRHRVCGEFLCGVSAHTLATLGVADLLEGSAHNRSTSWYGKNRYIFRADLPARAHGISRFVLDHRFARRFESSGGDLQLDDRADSADFQCEGTVVATGKTHGRSPWIGLKVHLGGFPGLREDLEMHLGDGAYVGVSRIEGNGVNLCGLFRRRPGLRASRVELLFRYIEASGMTKLGARARAAEVRDESFAATAGFDFPRGYTITAPGLKIGDVAGMIPPFTGNGMSLALESAEVVLPHLLAYTRGQIDWSGACRRSTRDARERFHSRLRAANLVHSFLTCKRGRDFALALASVHLLPFRALFRVLH